MRKNAQVAGVNDYSSAFGVMSYPLYAQLYPKPNSDTCRESSKTCGLCLEQHSMPSCATKAARAVSNQTSRVFTHHSSASCAAKSHQILIKEMRMHSKCSLIST